MKQFTHHFSVRLSTARPVRGKKFRDLTLKSRNCMYYVARNMQFLYIFKYSVVKFVYFYISHDDFSNIYTRWAVTDKIQNLHIICESQ